MGKWDNRKKEDDKRKRETDELAKALRDLNIDKIREIVERRKLEEYENEFVKCENNKISDIKPDEALRLAYLEILNDRHHKKHSKITDADMRRSKSSDKLFKDNPEDARKLQRRKKVIKPIIKRCRCK
jgi:hypothetical protein